MVNNFVVGRTSNWLLCHSAHVVYYLAIQSVALCLYVVFLVVFLRDSIQWQSNTYYNPHAGKLRIAKVVKCYSLSMWFMKCSTVGPFLKSGPYRKLVNMASRNYYFVVHNM